MPMNYLWKTRLRTGKGLKNKHWRMFLIVEAGDWMEWTDDGWWVWYVSDIRTKGLGSTSTPISWMYCAVSHFFFYFWERNSTHYYATHTTYTSQHNTRQYDWNRSGTTQAEESKEGNKERKKEWIMCERKKRRQGRGREGKRECWSFEAPCVVFSNRTHSAEC